mmetsp:Transcript_31289/g.90378  ORF Transcript_31289/g.90378 Transcript_31289/m.90378 type:complete len:315 (-) Transcript_31289:345-1289(-)
MSGLLIVCPRLHVELVIPAALQAVLLIHVGDLRHLVRHLCGGLLDDRRLRLLGLVRRRYGLRLQCFPGEASVPSVVLEILDAQGTHCEPLFRISVAEGQNDAATMLGAIFWEVDLGEALDDFPVNFHGVGVLKGCSARHHHVDHDAERPPIHCSIVTGLFQHLGRKVVRRPTDGVRLAHADFGNAHICELHVPIQGQQTILELQVPPNYSPAVHVLQAEGHASSEELYMHLGAREVHAAVLEDVEELAAEARFQQQEDVLLVPVRAQQAHHEVAVEQLLARLLVHDHAPQSVAHDVPFGYCFQRIQAPGRFMPL